MEPVRFTATNPFAGIKGVHLNDAKTLLVYLPMNPLIKIQHVLPDPGYTCFIVPSLLSKAECDELLNTEVKKQFQKAISNYPTYYRNNNRFVTDDTSLAKQLFEKVKPYLPEYIEVSSNIRSENGTWQLKELNNRLRFCRYSAHQYFHRHLDGVHYRDESTQSKLTFMIYLNGADEFDGGRTLFYKTRETKEIWASYIPRQGDLIVFDHNVWHEGEVLQAGEKFVLRSDILYTRNRLPESGKSFEGHLGYIWALLKWKDDVVLSGGRDREIKVWNSAGKLLRSLRGHQNSILCLEKLNDHSFVSGSRDRQIIVWKNFEIVSRISAHQATVLCLCGLGSETFASGGADNHIHIIRNDGTILKTLTGHHNWVWKIVKLDEGVIASCSEDGSIKIWDLKTGNQLGMFEEKDPVIALCWNNKTRQLLSGDLNGFICIRTLSDDYSERQVRTFPAHNGIIRSLVFIDEERFASGGEDSKIRVWNLEGKMLTEFAHHNFVQDILLLNHQTMLSASYDGTIGIWDV